jgi:hypothetical protein
MASKKNLDLADSIFMDVQRALSSSFSKKVVFYWVLYYLFLLLPILDEVGLLSCCSFFFFFIVMCQFLELIYVNLDNGRYLVYSSYVSFYMWQLVNFKEAAFHRLLFFRYFFFLNMFSLVMVYWLRFSSLRHGMCKWIINNYLAIFDGVEVRETTKHLSVLDFSNLLFLIGLVDETVTNRLSFFTVFIGYTGSSKYKFRDLDLEFFEDEDDEVC